MFSNARIGDRVWSPIFGWGTVKNTRPAAQNGLFVQFDVLPAHSDTDLLCFRFDGRPNDLAPYPALYWGECPNVTDATTYPDEPTRMVKGVAVMYLGKNGEPRFSCAIHKSKKTGKALKSVPGVPRVFETESAARKWIRDNRWANDTYTLVPFVLGEHLTNGNWKNNINGKHQLKAV